MQTPQGRSQLTDMLQAAGISVKKSVPPPVPDYDSEDTEIEAPRVIRKGAKKRTSPPKRAMRKFIKPHQKPLAPVMPLPTSASVAPIHPMKPMNYVYDTDDSDGTIAEISSDSDDTDVEMVPKRAAVVPSHRIPKVTPEKQAPTKKRKKTTVRSGAGVRRTSKGKLNTKDTRKRVEPNPTWKPRGYQQTMWDALQLEKRAAICFGTGCGKSESSLLPAIKYLNEGEVKRVFLLGPSSVVGQWCKHLDNHQKGVVRRVIKNGADFEKNRDEIMAHPWILFNSYVCFLRVWAQDNQFLKDSMIIIDEAHNLKTNVSKTLAKETNAKAGGKYTKDAFWAKALWGKKDHLSGTQKAKIKVLVKALQTEVKRRPNIINPVKGVRDAIYAILSLTDEERKAAYAKFISTVPQSLALIDACFYAKRVLLLTATPIPNAIDDFRNLYSVLMKSRLVSRAEFDRRVKNGRLFRDVSNKMAFYTVADNDPNFPTVIEKIHAVKADAITYNHMLEAQAKSPKDPNKNAFYLASRKVSSQGDSAKMSAVSTLLQRHKGQKVMIYCNLVKDGLDRLAKLAKETSDRVGVITGETKDRTDIVRRFNIPSTANDPERIDIILISEAGCEGLDLKGGRVVIHFSAEWNRARDEQIYGRFRRFKSHHHLPPSERNVTVYRIQLVKPDKRHPTDTNHLSPDQIIYNHSKEKAAVVEEFLSKLRAVDVYHQGSPKEVKEAKTPALPIVDLDDLDDLIASVTPVAPVAPVALVQPTAQAVPKSLAPTPSLNGGLGWLSSLLPGGY